MRKTIIASCTVSVFPSTQGIEDFPFRRSEFTVACEACGETYVAIETTAWRLANVGTWILEHANECPKAVWDAD